MTGKTLSERVLAARQGDLYEERAGIIEYMAGFSRIDAETRARIEYPAHVGEG